MPVFLQYILIMDVQKSSKSESPSLYISLIHIF